MEDPSVDTSQNKFKVVIAIDFGTTYSGYAYSFTDQPHNIRLNRNWGENRFNSFKTPTTVHISNDGKFKSLGFDAIDEYIQQYDIAEEDFQPTSSLCIKVKSKLLEQLNLGVDMKVKSNGGETFLAINVIGCYLRHLKECALEEIKTQYEANLERKHIRWVLTVPAIWTEQAKLFMREAAFKAGITLNVQSDQLLIALEPEAASFYCRNVPVGRFTGSHGKGLNMEPESQYMVIDAGGGTVDIVVHELTHDGNIVEKNIATGGACGGNFVNQEFQKLLAEIFGMDYIKEFYSQFPHNWLEVMQSFEEQKVKFKDDSGYLTVTGLHSFYISYKGTRSQDYDVICKPAGGKLNIRNSHIKQCYDKVVNKICEWIDRHINISENHPKLKYIFLVGGFANSEYLWNVIKEKYSSQVCQVLRPHEPSTAVVKGAVMFGHNPNMMVTRVSVYNYYYRTCTTQDSKPKKKKVPTATLR